jgi:ribosome-associated protein
MISVTDTISIREDELDERFVRAPGPGGQNVNKVATAVQLRFDAANSPNLPAAVYRRLVPLAGSRMTRAGIVVILASRFRSQEQNRRDALERLLALIREASIPPRHRRPTKPTRGSRERRLGAKKHRSDIKKGRGDARDLD